MGKKVKSTLRRYKRKSRISIFFILFILGFILIVASVKFINLAQTIEKIKSAVDISFFDANENLYFENGIFSINIPKNENEIRAVFIVEKSLNSSFSIVNKNFVYKVQGVAGEVEIIDAKDALKEKLIFTSDYADFSNEKARIYKNVIGKFITKEEVFDFKLTEGSVDKLQNIDAKNVIVQGSKSFLKTDFLSTQDFLNTIELAGSVLIKHEEKTIKAKKGLINMKDGEVERAEFLQNVDFTQKDAYNLKAQKSIIFLEQKTLKSAEFEGQVKFIDYTNKTEVVGNFAKYDAIENTLVIYDDVYISSSKNNLKIKANDFYYNEATKKGSFNQLKANENKKQERVNIEIEI